MPMSFQELKTTVLLLFKIVVFMIIQEMGLLTMGVRQRLFGIVIFTITKPLEKREHNHMVGEELQTMVQLF